MQVNRYTARLLVRDASRIIACFGPTASIYLHTHAHPKTRLRGHHASCHSEKFRVADLRATHRGELFVSEPLRISINHYGPHGHSYSHFKRIPILTLPDLENFPHGPVRILMRDGQRLPEPELVEARERQNHPPHPVSWRSSRRQAGSAIYNVNDTAQDCWPMYIIH